MTTKITEKNISSLANAGVQWQSVIIADGSTTTTGVAGRGYFINTTNAAHTFTLPATANFADTIIIKDYAGTFGTNKLTIARNGHNIQGAANNSQIGTNRASVTLVYVDVTRGWEYVLESNVADLQAPAFISATGGTITTSGNFKIHSFTGDGCFVVSQLGNAPTVPTGGPVNVDYLVIAGGAGGGCGGGGGSGGGGAGGYRTTFPSPGCNAGSFPITATTFPITVGGGGAGSSFYGTQGSSGSNSVFSTITSAGGGGGGGHPHPPNPTNPNGVAGGSGGGGFAAGPGCGPWNGTGGAGNTPPVSPPQGNSGGNGVGTSPAGAGGGGGGGSGAVGGNGSNPVGGTGGAGSSNSITGSPVTRAGGGGGAGVTPTGGTGGPGGSGGGGAGGGPNVTPGGTSGTANTGSGGGGAKAGPIGGSGGSGIVIIRYKFQ